jgi:hypothetical protein
MLTALLPTVLSERVSTFTVKSCTEIIGLSPLPES